MNQHRLPVHYGDGVHARVRRVDMWIEHGMVQLAGNGLIRQVPLSRVLWSKPQGQGQRFAHFTDGGGVQALDPATWDRWLSKHGLGASPPQVSPQPSQSWRWAALAGAMLMLVALPTVWWGLTH